MPPSTGARGWFHTASQNGEVFSNSAADDLLIRTSAPTQRLLMGPACAGSASAVEVGADAVTLNTSTVMHGSLFIGVGTGDSSSSPSTSSSITSSYTRSGTMLLDSSVTTLKIAEGAVDSSRLAKGAVSSSRIATGAVGPPALAPLCVGTGSLADASVTAGKLATGAVTLGALNTSISAPVYDVWTLHSGPSSSTSPFLYSRMSGQQATSNAYLAPLSAAMISTATTSTSTTLLNPSSGLVTFPFDGIYEVTSSLRVIADSNVQSLLPPPSSWFSPQVWFGSNSMTNSNIRVRLGYNEAVMNAAVPVNGSISYAGTLHSTYTGVFLSGDRMLLSLSPGGWTTSVTGGAGLHYDTSILWSYVSIGLLRPLNVGK